MFFLIRRICTIRSVDDSKIMAYCVNECDGSSGMGSRPRRFIFTGHSNGCIQVYFLRNYWKKSSQINFVACPFVASSASPLKLLLCSNLERAYLCIRRHWSGANCYCRKVLQHGGRGVMCKPSTRVKIAYHAQYIIFKSFLLKVFCDSIRHLLLISLILWIPGSPLN